MAAGTLRFPPALTSVPQCQTQRDRIMALERSRAILYRDTPGRAFVTLSAPFKSRIMSFFSFLSCQTAIRVKDFSNIFYLLHAFNFPTVSHLPSFVESRSLSAKTSIYISPDDLKGFISFDLMRSISD